METTLTPEKVKMGLKQVLKMQKYTYQDLAKILKCSLPTAKRILNQEELSLTRLIKIMDWLDISLNDLEKLVNKPREDGVKFNDEQDQFLSENPSYLSYLMKLRSGETPEDIQEKHKLKKASTDKYLIKLERLGLIKVTGSGKVKIPANSPTDFSPNGKLVKTNFRTVVDRGATYFKKMVNKVIHKNPHLKENDENEQKVSYQLHSTLISNETYRIYQDKLKQVFRELMESAETDEKINDKSDLRSTVVLLGMGVGSPEDEEYQEVIETFGPIMNV